MGPVCGTDQLESIMGYIQIGQQEGATLAQGGSRLTADGMDKGCFIEPTVFVDVQPDMRIAQEEIFGPVMAIMKFKTVDEVIARANNSNYGLAAGVVTKNTDIALKMTNALRVGTVYVNCYDYFDPAIPFGGYKMSGIGREHGAEAMHEYTQTKSITVGMERFQSRFDI